MEGERRRGTFVARGCRRLYLPTRQGDREVVSCLRTETGRVIWQQGYAAPYTVVVSGDLFFGLSYLKRGQFFCLDPRNGATLWTSDGRQADNAAIVDGGSVLLFLTHDAKLIVAKKSGNGFEPLRKYTVAASPTWAYPVMLDRGILIKDLPLWDTERRVIVMRKQKAGWCHSPLAVGCSNLDDSIWPWSLGGSNNQTEGALARWEDCDVNRTHASGVSWRCRTVNAHLARLGRTQR